MKHYTKGIIGSKKEQGTCVVHRAEMKEIPIIFIMLCYIRTCQMQKNWL